MYVDHFEGSSTGKNTKKCNEVWVGVIHHVWPLFFHWGSTWLQCVTVAVTAIHWRLQLQVGLKQRQEEDETRWKNKYIYIYIPWKSKTKQRMAVRMIHVKDSLLPMGKVWSLDFLGIYIYMYIYIYYTHICANFSNLTPNRGAWIRDLKIQHAQDHSVFLLVICPDEFPPTPGTFQPTSGTPPKDTPIFWTSGFLTKA